MFTPGGQIDLLTFAGLRGGGHKSQPPMPSPTYTDPVSGKTFSTTADLNTEIDRRTADAKAASDAAAAAAAQKAAQDEADFQTRKGTAVSSATQQTEQAFRDAGVDPSAYESTYIQPNIQRYTNTIQDLDTNPQGAFPTSLGQDIVNQALTAGRTAASNKMSAAFSPTYTTTALPDTSIDPLVSQIVSDQFDPLSAQLENAHMRGTLTDTGYAAATSMLNQKKQAATDSVRSMGMGVLGTERSNLGDYITGAKNAAANLSLGDTANFSTDPYTTQASTMVGSDLSGLAGAIRNQVGSTQFADLPTLLTAGGVVQGASNPAVTNPAAGGGAGGGGLVTNLGNTILNTQRRGLGTTGAF